MDSNTNFAIDALSKEYRYKRDDIKHYVKIPTTGAPYCFLFIDGVHTYSVDVKISKWEMLDDGGDKFFIWFGYDRESETIIHSDAFVEQ